MSSESAFRAHDWDNDEGWQRVKRSLEIPPNRDPAPILLKRQRKYYKDNIDPSYEAPVEEAPKPTPPSSASSSSSYSSQSSSQSSTSPRSQPSGTYGYGSAPNYGSANANMVYRDLAFAGPVRQLPESRGTIDFLLHAVAFILSFIYLIPLTPAQYAHIALSTALKAIAAAYALHVYYTSGTPRFSLDGVKTYLMSIMQASDAYVTLFAVFMHLATPIFPFALWTGIRGLAVAWAYIQTRFGNHPVLAKLRASPLAAYINYIPTDNRTMERYAAYIEVFAAVASIIYLLTPARSFMFTFMVWNFIRMRYLMSQAHRVAFAELHKLLSSRLSAVPKVHDYYTLAANKIYSFVDPDVLVAQARAQQQS